MLSLMTQSATGDTLAIMAEADLTLPQIVALQALRSTGPRNLSSIADLLNLSRPATSHLVDRLVGMRLVERDEDPEDRRHKRIQITRAGAILMDRLGQSRSNEFEQAMANLPDRLQGELAAVLEKVVEQLRQRLGRETRQVATDSTGGRDHNDLTA
jgi:DNA-binding MarR family transcriptional regulator